MIPSRASINLLVNPKQALQAKRIRGDLYEGDFLEIMFDTMDEHNLLPGNTEEPLVLEMPIDLR